MIAVIVMVVVVEAVVVSDPDGCDGDIGKGDDGGSSGISLVMVRVLVVW